MAQVDIWIQQANDAIRRGADPAKVEALLMQKMQAAGLDPQAPAAEEKPAPSSNTPYPSFDNKQLDKLQADAARSPEAMGALPVVNTVTAAEEAKAKAREEMGFGGRLLEDTKGIGASVGAGTLRAARGAVGIASGLAPYINPSMAIQEAMVPGSITDQGFRVGDALEAKAKELDQAVPNASEYSQLGAIIPALAGGFAVEPFNKGAEALNKGKSLTEAELRLAQRGAVNVAGVGAGMLGSQASGLLALGSRLANQVPASVALGMVDRELSGEQTTTKDIALDIGMGAFGSMFRNPTVERPSVRTGDVDVDAGIKLVEDLSTPAVRRPTWDDARKARDEYVAKSSIDPAVETIDMFSPENQLSLDMFSKESVPASLMERRRQRQKSASINALEKLEEQRTPEQAAQLERDYILDQQDRLNAEAQEGIVSRRGDIPEPFMGLADTIPADVNAPNPRQIFTREGETVGVRDQQPNTAMADAMLQGWIDRGQLRNESTPVPERQAELFEPSRNATVEQTAEQGTLDLPAPRKETPPTPAVKDPTQADLFNDTQAQTKIEEVAAQAPTTPDKIVHPVDDIELARAELDKAISESTFDLDKQLNGAGDHNDIPASIASRMPKNSRMATAVAQELASGKLTAGRALDAVINNEGLIYENAPVARSWARVLKDLGDRFGGLDNLVVIPDASTAEGANAIRRVGNGGGMYSNAANKIYLGNAFNMNTIVHEAGHAILSKAIQTAQRQIKNGKGVLDDAQLKAYQRLDSIFKATDKRSEVLAKQAHAKMLSEGKSKAEADFLVSRTMRYGFKDMHEMMSELHSNPLFREHLKSIKLTPEMMAPGERSKLSVLKNAYNYVKDKVRTLLGLDSKDLGLSPKEMDNALDAMFSGSQQYFRSLNDQQAAFLRSANKSPDAKIDTSWMGETVPYRDIAADKPKENLQAPRGRLKSGLKQAFSTKGIESKVFDAGQTRANLQAQGSYRASVLSNQMQKGLKKNPELSTPLMNVMNGEADAVSFLKGIEKSNPDLYTATKQFLKDRYTNALEYAKEVRLNPNATAQELAFAAKAFKQADSYIHRAYQANVDPPKKGVVKWMQGGFMGRKMAMAEKAESKLGEGRTNLPLTPEQKASLTKEEATSLNHLRAMRGFVSSWLKPSEESLNKMSVEDLGDLYNMYTKLDPTEITRVIPGDAAKKSALIAGYQDALSKQSDFNQFVDNTIKQLSGLAPDKTGAVIKYTQNMRLGKDVFAERSNVPPQLREWWGEIKNPVAQAILTLSNQTSNIAQLRSLRQLREDGLGTIFTEDSGTASHTEVLTGDKLGPLRGLRTTPDVKKALDSIMKIDQSSGDILDALVASTKDNSLAKYLLEPAAFTVSKLSSTNKLNSIVFNQGRWMWNFGGSPGQVLSNGNLNPKSYARGALAVLSSINSSKRGKINPDVETLLKYGILEPTQISEVRDGVGVDHIRSMLQKAAGTYSKVDAGKTIFGNVINGTKEFYSATDLWTKAANFFHDVDIWTEHFKTRDLKGMSAIDQIEAKRAQLKDEDSRTKEEKELVREYEHLIYKLVADRTNNSNITPSRAPALLRNIERYGGTQYLPYQYETFRTTVNNVRMGVTDAKYGAQTGDMRLMRNGIQRMIGAVPGMAIMQTGYHAGMIVTLGALGYAVSAMDDDSDLRKHVDTDASKVGSKIITITDEQGKQWTIDIGQAPPMDPAIRPTTLALEAVYLAGKGDTKGAEKAITNAGKQVFEMLSVNSMYRNLYKAVQGKDPSIARTDSKLYDSIQQEAQGIGMNEKWTNRLINLSEIYAPKGWLEISRGLNADSDTKVKAAIATGIGVRELNPAKDLNAYFGYERKQKMQDAKNKYADLMKQNFAADPETIEKKFLDGLKDVAKPYAELQQAVRAAKEQNTPITKIAAALKGMGLSEEMRTALLRGRKFPVSFMETDLKADLEQRLLKHSDDPKKQAELKKLYRENTRLIQRLQRKYRSTDVQELIDGK